MVQNDYYIHKKGCAKLNRSMRTTKNVAQKFGALRNTFFNFPFK